MSAVDEIVAWVTKDIQDTFHATYDGDCLRKVASEAIAADTAELIAILEELRQHVRDGYRGEMARIIDAALPQNRSG